MAAADPKSIEYMDGIAIHYYGNFIPASILSNIQGRYPDKILLSTEACEGMFNFIQCRYFVLVPMRNDGLNS